MPRPVRCGIIQCGLPLQAEEADIPEVVEAMISRHEKLIEEAGRQGVKILCLQEIFSTPYFPPSQDPKWYATAEAIPGPTVERMQNHARNHGMVMVVPIYEKVAPGIYYNTAAVIDADGTLLGTYRKNHLPHVAGFWEKFFFKPGNTGYPVFETRYAKVGVYICYDRHFPEGARLLGLAGAEVVFNPSATVAGLSQYRGSSSSLPTPWPTAISWGASIASAWRNPGRSGSSTAPPTSSIPGGSSWRRLPRMKTRSSLPISTWTSSTRYATSGSSTGIAAPRPTAT